MLEADELTAELKRAEAALSAEQKAVEADRRALATEVKEMAASLEQVAVERNRLARELDPQVLGTFELIAQKRNGVAIAEARDGHCTVCHVRLRPQVFNTVRRNTDIIQCDSCQRILFFAPVDRIALPAQ